MVRINEISKTDTFDLLKTYFKFNYGRVFFDTTGLVNVNDHISLVSAVEELPVKFGKVTGNFLCAEKGLTSLVGFPSFVGGICSIAYNNLKSLEGSPSKVGMTFTCKGNQLTSLNGGPKSVGKGYDASQNELVTLEGVPDTIGGEFVCYKNNLTSLKGMPSNIGGLFNCMDNPLTSLEGLPTNVKTYAFLPYSPHLPLLRLVTIPYQFLMDKENLPDMISKYRDDTTMSPRQKILALQKELIDNGYEGNAKW